MNSPTPKSIVANTASISLGLLLSFSSAVNAQSPGFNMSKGVPTQQAVHRVVRSIGFRTMGLKSIAEDAPRAVVRVIATDPSGESIAVAGDDHLIRIFETPKMKLVATLKGHSDLVRTLDFDATGDRLVSAGNDGQLIVWDCRRDYKIKQQMSGAPALACVRFSPDGQSLAAVGFSNKVFLMGRNQSTSGRAFECECSDLRSLAFSPDGKTIAAAGRTGDLYLFSTDTAELVGQFKLHQGRVNELDFLKGSPIIASVSDDGTLVTFNTESMQVVNRTTVTSAKLYSVTIIDRDFCGVAGSDNQIHVVNLASNRVTDSIKGHSGTISTVKSHDGMLYSGGFDATMKRWQLAGVLREEKIERKKETRFVSRTENKSI